VTGSKYLLEHGGSRVLIDAGLFQGMKELRERNWAPFDVPADSIDAIVITHAHLDHCGYLPRLVKAGFSGTVHVTADTGRLMSVVLPDSARLQEEEAKFANRHGYSRHNPALALYTEADAWAALDRLTLHAFGQEVDVAPGVELTFQPAGHILGSASALIRTSGGPTIRFSGDLGRSQHPLLRPPAPVGDVDYLLIESTYGDRIHADSHPETRLADLIDRTIERGGKVIIPAFSVDRTEVILYHLRRLHEAARLPHVPIYVDSPMALAALGIYRDAIASGTDDIRTGTSLTPRVFDLPTLEEVHDSEGSKAVSASSRSCIIIAGAGMASGGRVVHHLERFLPDANSSVALVGFQAAGTRGRQLLDGQTSVKIHGEYVPVHAEVCDLTDFSVHADANELMEWARTATRPPRTCFVVHGEVTASEALRSRLERELGWTAVLPALGERITLRK
jgi:metallo-beta-lactamase family protein